ncbi:MAG: ATP-binding cassette domain-containing protein [Atopobiaceae bacterium]|nr:ATP-binding cassette domain-containing protein [Atopobiaceae bacterium]
MTPGGDVPRRAPARAIARKVGVVAFWLVVWEAASLVVGSPLILAGPLDTAVALGGILTGGRLLGVVGFSFVRIVGGFLVAFVGGLLLGALSARHDLLRELLSPLMSMLKSTPVVCLVVLLLIWFGSANVSAVAVALVVLPAIWFTVVEAVGHLDRDEADMLDVFHVHGLRRLAASSWRQILPYLDSICRTVVGMSWKAGVAAELIGIPMGSMGERIYQSKLLLETADLFAWTAVIIALAFLCEKGFLWLLRRSGSWALAWSVRPSTHVVHPSCASESLAARDADLGHDGVGVLRGLTREFPRGSRTCLLDVSGAGKSTLLRALAGVDEPIAGTVEVPGRTGLSFQGTCLIDELSARGNVALVAGREVSAADIAALLGELLPAEVLDRPVRELSGGQRQRVELVRAMAWPSSAVLLDEPFAGLDVDMHWRAAGFVDTHLGGRTLVVATHDNGDAMALRARVAVPLAPGARPGIK